MADDSGRIEAKLDAILALLPTTVTIPGLKRWGFRCFICNREWVLNGPDLPIVSVQSLILSYLKHLVYEPAHAHNDEVIQVEVHLWEGKRE